MTRHLPLVALALGSAALALAGCGSSASADAAALVKAKAELVTSCLQGASTALDRHLCACIADEAAKRPEYDTPAKLDALRKDQDGDKVPAALGKVAMTCADRIGADG